MGSSGPSQLGLGKGCPFSAGHHLHYSLLPCKSGQYYSFLSDTRPYSNWSLRLWGSMFPEAREDPLFSVYST